MTRSYYDARPSKFEAVGNGSYIYRWDIQEEAAPQQIMAEGEDQPAAESSRTQYSCYDEAKAKIASYKDFLAARAALKAQIDADCAELNIE